MTVKEFRLPDLGEGLEEGDIVAWHVAVGDVVDLNQTVADVETAKAVVAIPAPFAGTVIERVGEEGDTLQVGQVFLRIETDAEVTTNQADTGAGPAATGGRDDTVSSGAHVDGDDVARGGSDGDEEPQPLVGYGQPRSGDKTRRRREIVRGDGDHPGDLDVLAKPPVRKLARDLGVDLAALAPGSGPGGIVTLSDVHAVAGATSAVGGATSDVAGSPDPSAEGFRGRRPGDVERIAGVRKRIVEKMETSRRDIPSASCRRDVDVTAMWELSRDLTDQAHRDGVAVKITPFALLLRATVLALRRCPPLHARIEGRNGGADGDIHLLEGVNLGFAVDTHRGLVVPNLKDAHTRSVLELATGLADLTRVARDGTISPGDLTGGTFTVNNYGILGLDDGEPIINPPEAGILGIGAMRERPWVVDGRLAVRRVATLRLVFDHRICDGGEAGRFVADVAGMCETPARMLLHS